MIRIIVLVNLKAGKTPADYERWAVTTDLPTVNALKSVDSFTLFQSTGLLGSDAKPPYDYIEIIDIADMDLFGQEVSTEAMGRIAAEFNEWSTPTFITTRPVTGEAA
ncbi:MAG TPA: REDY-like protein HapK [Sphingobium sp.]|uniref:REDY-like protein HapK n=1 Tax=Sphingobium sp. TaxID=1912891 RepID=UPI002ED58552